MNDLYIGCKVTCPITDDEGEIQHVIGKLVDINSRFAKIERDGEIIRVGKSKVEFFSDPEPKFTHKPTDRSKYESSRTSKGRKSYDKGDQVATDLRGKDLDYVYEYTAKKLGTSAQSLRTAYGHLNNGQQRMCLGNRVRKILKAAST